MDYFSMLSAVFLPLLFSCVPPGILATTEVEVDRAATERVCHDFAYQMNIQGSSSNHYERMVETYTNCTFVEGDLTITWLESDAIDYDLSFLRDIRYVRGSVYIVGSTKIRRISLPNLEQIRGNRLYQGIQGSRASLMVALNDELTELHMPKLREISDGDVHILKNPKLCHMISIDWIALMGRQGEVIMEGNGQNCSPCSQSCNGIPSCWGPRSQDCQQLTHTMQTCSSTCVDRCFAPGDANCCHRECAAGCTGPTNRDCLMCKNKILEGRCVERCPRRNPRTYTEGQFCVRF